MPTSNPEELDKLLLNGIRKESSHHFLPKLLPPSQPKRNSSEKLLRKGKARMQTEPVENEVALLMKYKQVPMPPPTVKKSLFQNPTYISNLFMI